MKSYLKIVLFLFTCIYVIIPQLTAQNLNKKEYFGTWRWVSGKNDTLELILKPNPAIETKLMGVHRYVEKGIQIESRFDAAAEDTAISVQSIYGTYSDKEQRVLLTISPPIGSNLQVNSCYLDGFFKIIPNVDPNKQFSLLSLKRRYESNEKQTLPSSIILEKIK